MADRIDTSKLGPVKVQKTPVDAAMETWWTAECRRGDPMRNTRLTTDAFKAGYAAGQLAVPEPAQPAESPEARAFRDQVVALFSKGAKSIYEMRDASPFHSVSQDALTTYARNLEGWARQIEDMPLPAASTARPTERGAVEEMQEACARAVENLKREVPYDHNRHPCTTTMKRAAAVIRAIPVAEQAAGEHSDDIAVDAFAALMKAKLAAARAKGRGGWDNPAQCSPDHLRDLLHDHVAKGDPVDVANFCMMLNHYAASTARPTERGAVEANGPKTLGELWNMAYSVGDFGAVEAIPATQETVDYIVRYGPRCRDCADEDQVCPASGLPCGEAEKAVRHVIGAINYGVAHGHLPALALPATDQAAEVTSDALATAKARLSIAAVKAQNRGDERAKVEVNADDVAVLLAAHSDLDRAMSKSAPDQEMEVMREALEPFAREAATWWDQLPDDARPWVAEPGNHGGADAEFTIGDLRRAAALATQPATGGAGG